MICLIYSILSFWSIYLSIYLSIFLILAYLILSYPILSIYIVLSLSIYLSSIVYVVVLSVCIDLPVSCTSRCFEDKLSQAGGSERHIIHDQFAQKAIRMSLGANNQGHDYSVDSPTKLVPNFAER